MTVVVIPVATLVMETWACGISFVEGSVMVPEIVPPATWAHTATVERIPRIKKADKLRPDEYTAARLRKDKGSPPHFGGAYCIALGCALIQD